MTHKPEFAHENPKSLATVCHQTAHFEEKAQK